MDKRGPTLLALLLFAVLQGHARTVNIFDGYGVPWTPYVNLSSVWLLPEEGYPVFYRYFRDRITWFEADAVCQFHHGHLVTIDSAKEFDAVRAYLKELDVANFVWTGLKRAKSSQPFLWPESRLMSEPEGRWAVEVPKSEEPLCAATDPSADFRWQPLPCSGPTVAAFICQMNVPSWARSGDKGCMLTSLPSLTVTFLPEQGAVELISDCGLEGTRRVSCKGQADHAEMLKQLSCERSAAGLNIDALTQSTNGPVNNDISSDSGTSLPPTSVSELADRAANHQTSTSSPSPTALHPTDLKTTVNPDTKNIHLVAGKTGEPPIHVPGRAPHAPHNSLQVATTAHTTMSTTLHSTSTGGQSTTKPPSVSTAGHSLSTVGPTVSEARPSTSTEKPMAKHPIQLRPQTPLTNITSLTKEGEKVRSPGQMEVAVEVDERGLKTKTAVKRTVSSKPIPPSLRGNSPFIEHQQLNNGTTEEPLPLESHEALGESEGPGSSGQGGGTGQEMEEYKKNLQDSGEDHTELITSISDSTPVDGMIADEADVPEKPNRGRLLLRPQHHSFYAYFLNRVLG